MYGGVAVIYDWSVLWNFLSKKCFHSEKKKDYEIDTHNIPH